MHRSPWWLMEAFDRTLRPLLWRAEQELRSYVAPGDRVADIGCGVGYNALALSELVGPGGEVVLVDPQEAMLERAVERLRSHPAARAKVTPVLADGDRMILPGELDFALVWWALHEVAEPASLWRQLAPRLRPAAKTLVVEPWLHVSRRRFDEELAPAEELGLRRIDVDGVFFSHAAVLTALDHATAR